MEDAGWDVFTYENRLRRAGFRFFSEICQGPAPDDLAAALVEHGFEHKIEIECAGAECPRFSSTALAEQVERVARDMQPWTTFRYQTNKQQNRWACTFWFKSAEDAVVARLLME